MDQYFERMYQLSSSVELLARIRFMLQDVLDLRAANWVPRKIAQVDGPRTIRQVCKDFHCSHVNKNSSFIVYLLLMQKLSIQRM